MNRAWIFAMATLSIALITGACMPAVLLPATRTPVAPVPPPPPTTAPCSVMATRTPPPGAPTLVPRQAGDPVRHVDPHIEICAVPTALNAGDTFTVVGQPVDIGLPSYTLLVEAPDTAEAVRLAEVTYANELRRGQERSEIVELVSAEGSMSRAVFVLRMVKPASILVRITATGEVHYGYPGPATWAGGASDDIQIAATGR